MKAGDNETHHPPSRWLGEEEPPGHLNEAVGEQGVEQGRKDQDGPHVWGCSNVTRGSWNIYVLKS